MSKRKRIDVKPVAPRHGYPRPMLERDEWQSLDGEWQFAIDTEGSHRTPRSIDWTNTITVPFAPETRLSGIEANGFFQACWYRRLITIDAPAENRRVILHFGAVDWIARVWINGHLAVRHEGGYTPFSCDITDLLVDGVEQSIVVCAEDDPHDMAKPRGKQDWEVNPHGIWYPRTTGIWQSVWLENVPELHIAHLRWSPDVASFSIRLDASVSGPQVKDLKLTVKLSCNGEVLANDIYPVDRGSVRRTIALRDPGIDDARNNYLWRPDRPNLIDAELTLINGNGQQLDLVKSYTALRTVSTLGDRFLLNGVSLYLRMALDQGYWPDSGLTAPDDEAIRRDVELALAMGFNGVRKHQKIEQPRFLYWADKLGLMVWEELPSVYAFSEQSINRLTQTWTEAIHRDVSHPCIIAWVPMNESWGVPNLIASEPQRDLLQALYSLTRAIDPTRPVVSNDGWELGPTDLITIHDYTGDLKVLAERYEVSQRAYALEHVQPAGRRLLLSQYPDLGQPIIFSEFGGIALSGDTTGTWGYSRVGNSEDLSARYGALLQCVRALPMFQGFCYTQFTDTYQEANGLLYMNRTPKFPIEEIAVANRGARNEADRKIEAKWSKRNLA